MGENKSSKRSRRDLNLGAPDCNFSAPTAAYPTFPSRYSCLNDVSLMFRDYFFRELRLMDVLDDLCDRMKLYSARAGPEFPYIKGGMT